jgi:hypothetical protein
MRIALRTKILTGVAALMGGYLIFWPADSAPVEGAKGERPASAARARAAATTDTHGEGAARALYLFAHRVADATAAGSLFAAHSWYVPPPPPPPVVAAPVEPLKPVAPPLPFQYIGSYQPAGETTVFFLSNSDRVYDVHIGDTLDNTYSVDSFDNGQLTFTYKPLNTKQQLAAGIVP